MGKIIELKKVNKWFDKFQVLKDIDLDVAPQEKIVICGPSGCLLYTSPSPRDIPLSRMPSSA